MINWIREFLRDQSLVAVYVKVLYSIIAVLLLLWACSYFLSIYINHKMVMTAENFAAEVRAKDYEEFSQRHLFTFGEFGEREYGFWKKKLENKYSLNISRELGWGFATLSFEDGSRLNMTISVDFIPPKVRIGSVSKDLGK